MTIHFLLTLCGLSFCAALVGNLLELHLILQAPFGVSYLVSAGTIIAYLLGIRHIPTAAGIGTTVFILLPLAIGGSLLYSLGSLGIIERHILFFLPIIGAASVWALTSKKKSSPLQLPVSNPHLVLPSRTLWGVWVCFIFFALFFFSQLLTLKTTRSVLGPWSVTTDSVFLAYIFLLLTLIVIQLTVRSLNARLASFMLFFFATHSLLLLLFPLGFGFDPHLHLATERVIFDEGVITPKTPYYIGYYVLTVLLSWMTGIPLEHVNAAANPVIATLLVGPLLFILASRLPFRTSVATALVPLLFFVFPLPFIPLSTPWNLSMTLALAFSISTFVQLFERRMLFRLVQAICACAALTLHPLVGLPLLGIFLLNLLTLGHHTWYRRIGSALVFFLSLASVPGAFLLLATISPQLSLSLHIPPAREFLELIPSILPSFQTRFHALLDLIYFFRSNAIPLLLASLAYGMWILKKNVVRSEVALLHLGSIGIPLVSAALLFFFFDFSSLISYEQHEFASRLLMLSYVIALPTALYGLISISERSFTPHVNGLRYGFFSLFIVLIGSAFYLSYPRNDAYASFHGYNVSKADIAAVRAIHADMGTREAVVLSNQVLAAASIREFGFTRYIHDDASNQTIFYYPVPTGSPLHMLYLQMREHPSRLVADEAMRLGKADILYFAIHRYEEHFAFLKKRALQSANRSFQISDALFIFVYENDASLKQ